VAHCERGDALAGKGGCIMIGEIFIAFWWIAMAAVLAWVAQRRGENTGLWFVISLAASPVLAVLFLMASPQRR
jgi:hypothetical protein